MGKGKVKTAKTKKSSYRSRISEGEVEKGREEAGEWRGEGEGLRGRRKAVRGWGDREHEEGHSEGALRRQRRARER